jgi:hypothetical protein
LQPLLAAPPPELEPLEKQENFLSSPWWPQAEQERAFSSWLDLRNTSKVFAHFLHRYS